MILHEMEVTSVEVDPIDHCNSQRFPCVVEEYLNMYIHSDFSLNPLVVGFCYEFILIFNGRLPKICFIPSCCLYAAIDYIIDACESLSHGNLAAC